MKNQCKTVVLMLLATFILVNNTLFGQNKNAGSSGPPKFKMTTPIPPGIECPDVVESRLGPLNFFDGFPDDATVEKLYDNLDFQRAVQAYLLGLPAVSMYSYREAIIMLGPANITIPTWENLVDSRAVSLTANCNTPYTTIWIDLRNGPVVAEIPPRVLGFFNDQWSRYVADVGMLGPDMGEGGKYLLLPPAFDGEIPGDYNTVRFTTYEGLLLYRHFAVDGDFEPAMESYKRTARAYLLSQAEDPPSNIFVNESGKEFLAVSPTDFKFWELLNNVVQGEPVESSDRISLGYFASIGIEKGKPFAPDDRMKKILSEAAIVGDATARAITYRMRLNENYFYENSNWRNIFLGGYKMESQPGVLSLDGYTLYAFLLLGSSPAEDIGIIGKGSQYAMAMVDANGNPFDGSKNYILHLPPDVPVNDFWSLIVYDYQTRSYLQTDMQFPMVSSQNKELLVNQDGTIDVYFGPKAPAGKENNWVQTIPGKGWFTFLRLYGPGKAWFDKTWRPGEINMMN